MKLRLPKHTITLAILLFQTNLYCFSLNTDSLFLHIKKMPDNIKKADLLNNLSSEYMYSTALSKKFAEQALIVSEKINYSYGKAKAYNYLGTAEGRMFNSAKAIEYFEKALIYSEKVKNKTLTSTIYANIANSYRAFNDYDKSIYYYLKSIDLLESLKDSISVAKQKVNLLSIYMDQNKYILADSIGNSLIPILKNEKDKSILVILYGYLGIIAGKEKNYAKAIQHYKIAINYAEPEQHEKYIIYSNLTTAYIQVDSLKKAEEYIKLCFEYFKNEKSFCSFKYAFYNKYEIEYKKNEFAKALVNLDSSAYYHSQYCNPDKSFNMELYENYSLCYNKLNNPAKALEYYKLFKTYSDSINDELKNKSLLALQTQYETKEKEAKIKILNTENNKLIVEQQLQKTQIKLRNIILVLFIIIVLIIFILYNRYKVKQRLTIENEAIKSEKEILKLEQQLLLSQMNPHFIFNSLNSINALITENDSEKTSKYLTDFSKLMRLILESSRKELITLENEIEIIEYYLQLEQLRLNNKFDYYIDIDEKIAEELTDIMIPSMLLQPYVENAIIHGISPLKAKGKIIIKLYLNDQSVNIEIEDNGVGRLRKRAYILKTHKSLGTKISEERIIGIEKKYKQKSNLKIVDLYDNDNNSKGTKVFISLPIIVNEYTS